MTLKSNEVLNYWKEEELKPFDEMIISWNGKRPKEGRIDLYVRVLLDDWTPPLLYASWGHDLQTSYNTQIDTVKVYQDAFQVLGGKKAEGFQIEATSPLRVHVYTNDRESPQEMPLDTPVYLHLDGLSQMALDHPRHRDLCSPTSTTAVIRYLTKKRVDPIHFAERSWDHQFDIFGNWVLNVAESSHYLGPTWKAWVQKLNGFSEIYRRLLMGTPVIVSVRGPLPGSAQPYLKGHLMVVTGFDPAAKEVHCMDPAFETDEKTHVRYKLEDFLTAWSRRENIAYVFERVTSSREIDELT